MSQKRRRRRRRSAMPAIIIIFLIIVLSAIYMVTTLIGKYTPSKTTEDLSEYYSLTSEDDVAIIYNYENSETTGKLIDGSVYLPLDYIQANLNSRFYWDASENLLLYATDSSLIRVPAESSTYTNGTESVTAEAPVVTFSGDTVYVLLDFVTEHSDFNHEYFEDPSRLLLTNQWGMIETAVVQKTTEIRRLGGIKSPIIASVAKNDTVTILARDKKWTKVMTSDGIIGFMRSKFVSVGSNTDVESLSGAETFTHITRDEKLCIAFDQTTNRYANMDIENSLEDASPVNVIAPTWFALSDGLGNITSNASHDYVTYCHSKDIEVWATVNNMDDPDSDSASVLNSTTNRTALVNNLMEQVLTYDIDGINVDFESLNEDEIGDSFIEFVRELSIECQQNDIVLSVDNYPLYYFNEFYNRAEQANFADYIILMAYDEHYSGSDAGSVSSLSWASDALTNTLAYVPADQLILGNPFYTRLWILDSSSTDSQAIGMNQAAQAVAKAGVSTSWDDETSQNFATWTSDDGTKYEIWLEDEDSMKERMDLVSSNSLAGAAFWKLGFENSDAWSVIDECLNQ